MTKSQLDNIEDVIADARQGKVFILVDDEDRENEGDLCVMGEHCTPEAINFMAKYGRGLICLAITAERSEQLGLSLMERRNESRHQTAFTVSIEAREGVSTGISAHDRSHTVLTAINPECDGRDITTPGHIFPLIARDGGTLVRAGHTEAVVDISRAAGGDASGVICEIMKDDGTMARLPDLLVFAKEHDLKIGSIADLIAWRRRNENLVSRMNETVFQSQIGGDWRMMAYRNLITDVEHLVLVKGDIDPDEATLVRMHSFDLMRDFLGEGVMPHNDLHKAMAMIAEEGKGLIVILREMVTHNLSDMIARRLQPSEAVSDLRDYGVGAQILKDLDVRKMTLLSNSQPNIVGLEGHGLSVDGWRALDD